MTELPYERFFDAGMPLTILCRRPSGPPRMNHRWDGQTCRFCGMDKAHRYPSQPPPVNIIAAADALADAASKPCNCFDGQLDWAYKQHNEPKSGIDDCPVQAALDAYRKARGDAAEPGYHPSGLNESTANALKWLGVNL